MTFNQAKRIARSLNYRRRLSKDVPKLEARLKGFITDNVPNPNTDQRVSALLGTYKVTLENESLTIEVVDPIDPNQMRFEFYEEVEDEDRKSREDQTGELQR